jgi:tetratricopeptide (TPR) repeat protein
MMKDRALDRYRIARIAARENKTDEAIRDLKDSVSVYEQLLVDNRKNGAYLRGLAEAALELGELHWQLASLGTPSEQGGRLSDAASAWEKSVQSLHTALAIDPNDAEARKMLAAALGVIGASYGRMGLWEEANRHYSAWLRLTIDGIATGIPQGEQAVQVGCVATMAADLEGHRRACAELERRLPEVKDAAAFLHFAWMRSLPARPPGEPVQALQWAKRGKHISNSGWDEFVLALTHYRAGQWKAAIDAAGRSIRRPWEGTIIMNYPVLAMAHQQLGQAAQADAWLRRAKAEWARLSPLRRSLASPTILPSAERNSGWSMYWHDWFTYDHLNREAAVRNTGAPPLEQASD